MTSDPNRPDSGPDGVPKNYSFADFQRENRESEPPKSRETPAPEAHEPRALESSVEKSIPIPPTEETSSPSPKPTPEKSTPAKTRPSRWRFLKTRRFAVAAALLAAFAILGGGLALGVLTEFQGRATKFDLDQVSRIDSGSVALDRNGELLGQVALRDRRKVQLKSLPDHLVDALIATEDSRFFEHDGIDPKGIARAAVANLKAGGISQGGSTITQQLARHSFDLRGRTYSRKLLELFLAQRIENAYTKDEILEHYLNRIYLGSGFWGVEAASRGYFGKPASEINLSEAATLCAIIKSPNRFSPFNDPEAARAARDRTLIRMRALETIDEATFKEVANSPLVVVDESRRSERPDYLLAAVRREALDLLGQYADLRGLEIQTSVDGQLQRMSQQILSRHLDGVERREGYPHPPKESLDRSGSTDYLQGAVVIIENETARIVATTGGRDYEDSEFDRVWQANRKPGTVLAPLLFATAFDAGKVAPLDSLLDAPMDNREVMVGGTEGVLGEWGAERLDNDYEGKISALYALIAGKNAATVRAGFELGIEPFAEILERLGLQDASTQYPNTFLGEGSVQMLDLARAYTIFPNKGRLAPEPSLITSIRDEDGKELYRQPEKPADTRVLSEKATRLVDAALTKTFDVNPVRLRSRGLPTSLAATGGTSHGFQDGWFIGHDHRYTWAVWVGFDKPKAIAENAFATDYAFPAWGAIAMEMGKEKSTSDRPTNTPPTDQRICLITGNLALPGCLESGHGDFTFPIAALEGWDLPELEPCPLHGSTAEGLNFTSTSPIQNEMGNAPSPIIPTVEVVVGGNPWATPGHSTTPTPAQ